MSNSNTNTDDLRIMEVQEVHSPATLIEDFPLTDTAAQTVSTAREESHKILHGEDDRLIVVVGPCSIHDPKAALEYAGRLAKMRDELKDNLHIIMRVYFEKPRTSCLLYTSPSPRDKRQSRMPSSA